MSLRYLNQIYTGRDISETSQKHLKRDVFFVTFLSRLKYISKKISFVWRLSDVSGMPQERCLFRDVSETSQKHLSQLFLVFQKYVTKMAYYNIWQNRCGTVRNTQEMCIDINQSSLPSGLISKWEFWQVKDCQNPIVNVLLLLSVIFFNW